MDTIRDVPRLVVTSIAKRRETGLRVRALTTIVGSPIAIRPNQSHSKNTHPDAQKSKRIENS